jgi:hypothetical protein
MISKNRLIEHQSEFAKLALGHSIKGIQAGYDNPAEYKPMIDHALQCVRSRDRQNHQSTAGQRGVVARVKAVSPETRP